MSTVTQERATRQNGHRVEEDAHANELARRQRLRTDGARSLGDNLEQADVLVKAAFELLRAFADDGARTSA